MEKLKIDELEVGKEYHLFYKNKIINGIFKINDDGKLFVNYDEFTGMLSGISYNIILDSYFIEIKKEIDWSKIQRGTKVQVRNYEEREWKNAYFIKYNSQEPYYPFVISSNLDDDFSSYKMEHNCYYARHCRIHPSVEIPDEWYKEVKE